MCAKTNPCETAVGSTRDPAGIRFTGFNQRTNAVTEQLIAKTQPRATERERERERDEAAAVLSAIMDDQRSLRSKASQSTLVSLLEIDPAPMDSPNANKDDPLLEENTDGSLADSSPSLHSTSTSTSLGLSGSGHGAIYYRQFPAHLSR